MKRKGFKYVKGAAYPCPKCGYDTQETKELSMTGEYRKSSLSLINGCVTSRGDSSLIIFFCPFWKGVYSKRKKKLLPLLLELTLFRRGGWRKKNRNSEKLSPFKKRRKSFWVYCNSTGYCFLFLCFQLLGHLYVRPSVRVPVLLFDA